MGEDWWASWKGERGVEVRVGVRVRREETSSIVERGCWGREGMERPMGRGEEVEDIVSWECGRL